MTLAKGFFILALCLVLLAAFGISPGGVSLAWLGVAVFIAGHLA